jgi:YaiO family outer membrane protein
MNFQNRPILRSARLVAAVCLISGLTVCAQDTPPSPTSSQVSSEDLRGNTPPQVHETKLLTNYVETGGSYLGLTNAYGSWTSGYVRSVFGTGRNIWNGEMNGQHEFGDSGVYFAGGDTFNFNPDWYGSITVGSSAGGFFWPRYRADGFLNKKWLKKKQLITTLGLGYYAAKDVHHDRSFSLGTTYYFEKPWIVEDGIRFNISNPGAVFSPAGFIAVTEGRDKHHYITVRAGAGKEAYQLIGTTTTLADFDSQTFSVTWRCWAGRDWGINLVGDLYHNPFYFRGGTSFGLFKQF